MQLLNGANVGDPAAIGFSMNYYDPTSFQNIQVTTGAQDISLGTSGVSINMVTKSGTNSFSGSFLQTYQGEKTQWDNIDQSLKDAGFRPERQCDGPADQYQRQRGRTARAESVVLFRVDELPADSHQRTRLPGRVAPAGAARRHQPARHHRYLHRHRTPHDQLNPSNRFDIYGSKQRYDKPNRGAGTGVTQDSTSKEYDIDNTAQVLWSTVLSDRLFANSTVSYNNVHFPLSQKTALQPLADNAGGVQLRNDTNTAIMFRRRLTINSNWTYYVRSSWAAATRSKAGSTTRTRPRMSRRSVSRT